MAETVGSLVDKIAIMELKLYHMQEQMDRTDVPEAHRVQCTQRWATLKAQRDDLVQELNETMRQWTQGRWRPKIYRQYKMYNDPRFRISAKPPAPAR